MPVAITTDEQDVYPPRVLVSVTGLTAGDDVVVYRVVAGERTALRAGAVTDLSGTSWLVLDAELPFGTPVSYVAVVNGTTEYTSSSDTHTLPGGKVVISDAISGQAAEVVILAWPEKTRLRRASVYRVGESGQGRNVVVAGPVGGFEADVELYVESAAAVQQLESLLAGATAGVVQIRQPGGYEDVDCYATVMGWTKRRWSQAGSDDRRTVVVQLVESEAWAAALEAAGYTLGDLADVYDGLTLDDLAGDFATLLDIAQAEFIP